MRSITGPALALPLAMRYRWQGMKIPSLILGIALLLPTQNLLARGGGVGVHGS